MKKLLTIFAGLLLLPTIVFGATVFYSNQVGNSPSNGKVLQTDGTNSTWVATSSLGITGSGTVTTLTAGTNITFSSGATCTTTCTINATGGGTNYFTNSGNNTYLNTGLNLQAPTFEATSTSKSVFPYASTTGLTVGSILNFIGYSSSPQLYAGDPQTGLHFDGPGIISFHNSNIQTLLLSSTNNVGIGSTSPGQKLSVAGDILGHNIIGTRFNATGTTASLLPYASSTAITATTAYITNLANLVTGFVKVTNGALSVDTNTYLTGNQSITLSGDVSGTGSTAITTAIGNNKVTVGMLAQAGANTILGNPTGATANIQAFSTSTLGIAISDTTGTLQIPRGGTSKTSFTSNQLHYGDFSSVATTSVSCGGIVTCTSFTAIGAAPITISASAGTSASSTLLSDVNAWTGREVFSYASTTQLTLAGQLYDGSNSNGTAGYTLMSRGGNNAPVWSATTTFNSPLNYSNGAVTLSTAGTWSGNAGTATSLAADGTDCSVGSYARGVDASGNAQNCTVASTGTVTSVTGTFPIASSGGNTPNITFSGLSTSSPISAGANVLYATGVNTVASVATGTVSGTNGITVTVNRYALNGALAIDCTVASGSNAGCLSTTDWTTFNNKQATLSATFPQVLTGATLSFGGLGTSSAAVVGNIPYFSGVNTFANVATTSVTCTGGTTCSQFTVIGSSPITINSTGSSGGAYPFTPASTYNTISSGTSTALWLQGSPYSLFASSTAIIDYASTTALTVRGNTYLDQLSGVLKATNGLVSTGVDGTDFTLVDAITCTNQVLTAFTAAGVGTCSSINNAYWSGTDLSVANGGTGLSTFGGSNTILYTTAADTLASEAAFIYNQSVDRLTVPYASTTAFTADTICFTADTCRTTWPTSTGGSGGGTWSTTTSQEAGILINYPNNNTDVVAIGGNSTTTAEMWFNPNLNGISFVAGLFGIGTTSPYRALSVGGGAVFGSDVRASNFIATSTTNLSIFNGPLNIATTTFGGVGATFGGYGLNVGTSTLISGTNPTLSLVHNTGPSLIASLYSESGGQVLDYGVNYPQAIGAANSNYAQGFFRINVPSASQFFSLTYSPSGFTSSVSQSQIFTISNTGFITGSNIILTSASSTIGAGGQTTGLTISGGATTTGSMYIGGNIGIGTTSPNTSLVVNTAATTTITVDSTSTTKGGCIKLRDYDGVGYTYITANNGTLRASTASCQ